MTEAVPSCYVCGAHGDVLHVELEDLLYGAEGRWTLRRCVRPSCGLMWLDPRWRAEELWRAYRTYYTHAPIAGTASTAWSLRSRIGDGRLQAALGYEGVAVGPRWHRALAPLAHLWPGGVDEVDITVAFLPAPSRPSRVLDVGCGEGRLLARLQALGWTGIGHDVDPQAVAVARQRGLAVTEGDLLAQAYPDASFDAVVLSHVIEHVHDPGLHLRECHRVLRPGGRLVLLTPNGASWGHRHFGRDWRGLEPPRHLHIFNPETIRTVFTREGLHVQAVRTLSQGARTILSLSAAIRWSRLTGHPWTAFPRRQLKGVLYQLRERAAALADADAGEELLAIATRE